MDKDFIKGYYITLTYFGGGVITGQHCGLFESLSISSDTLKNYSKNLDKIIVENYYTKEVVYLYENGEIKVG